MSAAEAAYAHVQPQPTSAGPAARRTPALELLFIVAAAVTPLLAYLNYLGFAVLVALGGLLCLPLLFRRRRPLLGFAYLALLTLWAAVSMSWSIFHQPGAPGDVSFEDLTALKMAFEVGLYGAFVVGALALAPASAHRASLAMAIAVAALSVLFLGEGLAGARLYAWLRTEVGQPLEEKAIALRDVKRVSYALAVLFWPTAVVLATRKLWWAAGGVAAATVGGAMLLGAEAPALALVLSAPVFLLVQRFGRRGVSACLIATCAYFALTPLLVHAFAPAGSASGLTADPERVSWAARLDIWRFAAQRVLERPFFGWGLDASRMFSPNIQLHTHNGALQVWLELGAVGAALVGLFWSWLFGRIDRIEARDRTMAAAAAAAAAVYLMIGALSFGIWQEWWIALGVLGAASCIATFIGRRGSPAAASGA